MAAVGVWLPWTETLLLAARFGMDAHTCEAAAQSWASLGLAKLDPLPRHCKGPTDHARIRLLPAGDETDVLSVSKGTSTCAAAIGNATAKIQRDILFSFSWQSHQASGLTEAAGLLCAIQSIEEPQSQRCNVTPEVGEEASPAYLHCTLVAGRKFCVQKQNLFGQLEGDARTIRKIYVSKTNPEFQDEIQDAMRRWKAQKPGKPEPKYWLGHVRIAGIKACAAATVVVALPTRHVPPGSSPPVESFVELKNSGLINHISTDRGRRCLIHSDGAQAWPRLVSDMGKAAVTSDHVSHSKHEFARKVAVKRRTNRRPAAYITGTQSIDRWWQTAQDFVPPTFHAKHGKDVNPDLFRYLFAFVWRYQLSMSDDFIKALAQIS